MDKKKSSGQNKKFYLMVALVTVIPFFIMSKFQLFNIIGFLIVFIPYTIFITIWTNYRRKE